LSEIKTSVSKQDGNSVLLEVEVPGEEVKARVDRTVKRMARDVRIPGFRKGKVPRPVLYSNFGKEAILAQTLSDALPDWYQEAVDGAGIKPIDQPELDFDSLEDEDKPFSFKATVEVPPRPVLGKYTGLEVEKPVVSIDREEVEEQVDRLRLSLSKLEPQERDRAESGDFVLIDFTGKDHMLELGSGSFIPGFEEGIEGMKKGETKQISLTFPENYQPGHLAGKEVQFDVALKEIKEQVLPEADDDFAAEASEFETVKELRESIEGKLREAREENADHVFRQNLVEQAMEASEVEIPAPMIKTKVEEMKEELDRSLRSQGASIDVYIEQTGMDEAALDERLSAQAEVYVKQELVLDAIAESEGIEVTDDDIEQEIRDTAEKMGYDPEALLEGARDSGHDKVVRRDLLRRGAIDRMAESAVPILKKEDKKGEGEEGAEQKIIEPGEDPGTA
jgi:trigger factor